MCGGDTATSQPKQSANGSSGRRYQAGPLFLFGVHLRSPRGNQLHESSSGRSDPHGFKAFTDYEHMQRAFAIGAGSKSVPASRALDETGSRTRTKHRALRMPRSSSEAAACPERVEGGPARALTRLNPG